MGKADSPLTSNHTSAFSMPKSLLPILTPTITPTLANTGMRTNSNTETVKETKSTTDLVNRSEIDPKALDIHTPQADKPPLMCTDRVNEFKV